MIRDYLLTVLNVPVYIDVPAKPGSTYVVIQKTGGGEREHIRSATIAVQSYGPSRFKASELHEEVLSKLPAIADGVKVSACDLNAEYNFTGTDIKAYRYQAVYDIIYY